MTISSTAVVDFVAVEQETGHIVLSLLDDLDWSNEREHLRLLQEKLNTYLRFIEAGEVYETVSRLVGAKVAALTPIKVRILARFELPVKVNGFLQYASRSFHEAGFALEHQVVVPGTGVRPRAS